jgi:hypothetical protein
MACPSSVGYPLRRVSWRAAGSGVTGWGHKRVELHPDSSTQTYGRGNFFIHGGWSPGSGGCITLCERDVDFFSAIPMT